MKTKQQTIPEDFFKTFLLYRRSHSLRSCGFSNQISDKEETAPEGGEKFKRKSKMMSNHKRRSKTVKLLERAERMREKWQKPVIPNQNQIFNESLILAQDERWRRA